MREIGFSRLGRQKRQARDRFSMAWKDQINKIEEHRQTCRENEQRQMEWERKQREINTRMSMFAMVVSDHLRGSMCRAFNQNVTLGGEACQQAHKDFKESLEKITEL